jgi:hypothetical protein
MQDELMDDLKDFNPFKDLKISKLRIVKVPNCKIN